MAGRPRTPTKVHVLRGTEQKHPERMRERAREPKCNEPLGDPPRELVGETRRAWEYLADSCPPGMLVKVDRALVQSAAVILARLWADPMGIDVKEINTLANLLSKLGMTPVDRSKVKVDLPPEETNPFAAMLPARTGT